MRKLGGQSNPLMQYVLAFFVAMSAMGTALVTWSGADETSPRVRKKPWRTDHVGERYPEYVTGDECLFCHRTIGPLWDDNRHQLTIRRVRDNDPALKRLRDLRETEALAAEVQYLMGTQSNVRFLKRAKAYGKLDLLSTSHDNDKQAHSTRRKSDHNDTYWDTRTFADRCAGCHTTAVDSNTRAFTAISLDCFVCHGNVDLAHTKDVRRVFLSAKNRDARRVISTCGQCHLRGGESTSTGRPYPNTYIAGDNLFRDYRVDLSPEAISEFPAIEQHIYLNTRQVEVLGLTSTTCLSCHDVHQQKTDKHQKLANATICSTCHAPNTDKGQLLESISNRSRRPHNKTCGY